MSPEKNRLILSRVPHVRILGHGFPNLQCIFTETTTLPCLSFGVSKGPGAPCPASGTWVSESATRFHRANNFSLVRLCLSEEAQGVGPTENSYAIAFLLSSSAPRGGPAFALASSPHQRPPARPFTSASARSIAAYNWSGSVPSIQ